MVIDKSYSLGGCPATDYLYKFGIVSKIINVKNIQVLFAFPKLKKSNFIIYNVNNKRCDNVNNWNLGDNLIDIGEPEKYVLTLEKLEKKIFYGSFATKRFFILQVLSFESSLINKNEYLNNLKKYECIVLDLRFNFGGAEKYMKKFLSLFLSISKGKRIFLLFSNTTASSAEEFIQYFIDKLDDNVTLIGNDTYGKEFAYKKVSYKKIEFFIPSKRIITKINSKYKLNTNVFYPMKSIKNLKKEFQKPDMVILSY